MCRVPLLTKQMLPPFLPLSRVSVHVQSSPPDQTDATSLPPTLLCPFGPLTNLQPASAFEGNKALHFAAVCLSDYTCLSLSVPLTYMTLNNLMLQLSDCQTYNLCFCFDLLSEKPVEFFFWPFFRVHSPLRYRRRRQRDGGGIQKWQKASKLATGVSRELKILVA